MSITTSVMATGAIVVAGRIAGGQSVDVRIAIGAGAFAFGLSLIANASELLASRFALLVLILAMFRYVPVIAEKTGLTGGP